jgi:hypothetical protein
MGSLFTLQRTFVKTRMFICTVLLVAPSLSVFESRSESVMSRLVSFHTFVVIARWIFNKAKHAYGAN